MKTTSQRLSQCIYSHRLEKDDISDIALSLVDIMVWGRNMDK